MSDFLQIFPVGFFLSGRVFPEKLVILFIVSIPFLFKTSASGILLSLLFGFIDFAVSWPMILTVLVFFLVHPIIGHLLSFVDVIVLNV